MQDPAKCFLGCEVPPHYLQCPRMRIAVATAELRNSAGAPLEVWVGLQPGAADVEVVRGAFRFACATGVVSLGAGAVASARL